jgi:hypothetical protein
MSIFTRSVIVAFCFSALAVLGGTSSGCGGADNADKTPRWETVVSSEVSGAKPVKLLLGTYELGDRVRIGWDLSGPDNRAVTFTLRAVEISRGTGFGASVSPGDPLFALHSDEVLVLGPLRPGDYRLYFSQRFPPSKAPGYDVKFTIATTK